VQSYAVPRIALDTDVVVAAMLGEGAASRLVGAVMEGQFEPLMGPALYAEHEAVLGRAALFERCRLSAKERAELFDIYLARCRWTRIYFLWRPNLQDESDNHLVELAVAGGAQAIVTRAIPGALNLYENAVKVTGAGFYDLAILTALSNHPASYQPEFRS